MDSICNEENFTGARLSPHTATGPNAIYLSLCQPAATVRLHHRFGELGNQNSGRKGCLISTLQMTCMSPAFFPFSFVALSLEFGSSSDQIFHKKHVKSTKWRWTAYAMKRISRRRGCHRTQRLAPMPFISASVSLQRLCDCTIDLETLENQNSGRKGCLISTLQMTCMRPAFFRFHLLH